MTSHTDTPAPTALVTGASRGLGLALARRLAADGHRLVIDGRDAAALERARVELAARTEVVAIAGDVADEAHRVALATAAPRFDAVILNASELGPSPLPALANYPLDALEHVFAVNVFAPLRLVQLTLDRLAPDAVIVAVTSDAAVEAYPGWGGYGASKAALEQLFAVLAAERPDLRIHRVDPGDMRTAMHQAAFPGEDISDRPPPEESVPGIVSLLRGGEPSARHLARRRAGVEA